MNRPAMLLLAIMIAVSIMGADVAPAGDESELSTALTLEMALEMESVSGPRLSPDGSHIIYTRGWIDKVNDRRRTSVWIMDRNGGRQRLLTEGSGAAWSPSGDRIAYVAEGKPNGSQIFVLWLDETTPPTQITRVDRTPGALAWSPDGTRIAFTMDVEDRASWSISLPKAPKGAKWVEAPKIVERLNWRRDRVGDTDTGWRQIFVVPAEGGTPRALTSGPYDHHTTGGPLEWTPDGERIVFTALREEDADWRWRESEIYAVEAASGEVTQLTTRKGPDGRPRVSPDGKQIAYTGYDWSRDTWTDSKIYVMDADGSNPRLVSGDWDRSPSALFWRPDGRALYFTARDAGAQNLYELPLTGRNAGRVVPLTQGTHLLAVTDIVGGLAVGTRTTPERPGEVVRLDPRSPADITQLTFVNEDVLGGVTLGELHEIRYTSLDDLEIQGWYITPPDFDPEIRYPMQLHIHGGPHAMYGVGFNFGWQWQAAQGYVILYTNPRGSTGYGSAFGNAIMNAYPGKDYDDLMAGVDLMLSKQFIDEEKLFVTGGSGGGVLTAWIVGHTDRFAAASSNFPVIDWLSFVGTTDGSSWYMNFEQLPWEDPGEHLRRSPLMHVGNVTTPTMLMTGVNDLRTPIAQTEQFYSALKLRKVPTAMIRFNDEWHGTGSRPSNFMRTQLYLKHWFELHGNGEETRDE
jgi:dipeptidyl aminopeptidase/acylaminoacyl peptidase